MLGQVGVFWKNYMVTLPKIWVNLHFSKSIGKRIKLITKKNFGSVVIVSETVSSICPHQYV
jgi:hypothetical protein